MITTIEGIRLIRVKAWAVLTHLIPFIKGYYLWPKDDIDGTYTILFNAIPSSVYVVLGALLAAAGIYLHGKKKAAKEIAGETAQVQLENIHV